MFTSEKKDWEKLIITPTTKTLLSSSTNLLEIAWSQVTIPLFFCQAKLVCSLLSLAAGDWDWDWDWGLKCKNSSQAESPKTSRPN